VSMTANCPKLKVAAARTIWVTQNPVSMVIMRSWSWAPAGTGAAVIFPPTCRVTLTYLPAGRPLARWCCRKDGQARSFQRVNDHCGGDGSAAAEGLLARAGCTPGRSRHNAAMSHGTGWHPAGGLVINSAAHNAPSANSAALTSNMWVD